MPLPARQRFDAGEVEQRVSQVDAIGAPQEPGVAASAAPRSSVPLFIATTLRPDGTTGVHSHIKQ
ncbi:MAG TPA: hypothetical protein VMD28_09670, partial [Acidimicrobiales bacterium]|nr:hypothetical protein [Acidimicrobiales bacterium]